MEAKDLTPLQRIEILEDVLRKLESGDMVGGLCLKIKRSAFELFQIQENANEIIPIFTLENAKRVTAVNEDACEVGYWWGQFFFYDFENRIKFVQWMINEEKLIDEQHWQNEQWENNMSNLYTYGEDGFCDGFTNW